MDFLEHRAGQKLLGSNDSTKAACKANLISSEDVRMDMNQELNQGFHTFSLSIPQGVMLGVAASTAAAITEAIGWAADAHFGPDEEQKRESTKSTQVA